MRERLLLLLHLVSIREATVNHCTFIHSFTQHLTLVWVNYYQIAVSAESN